MVHLSTLEASARNEVINKSKGYQEREELRQALLELPADKTLQLEPDQGENLRKLKVSVRWAAREAGREIKYGETPRGTLLVWLNEAQPRRRGRRRKVEADPDNMAAQTI